MSNEGPTRWNLELIGYQSIFVKNSLSPLLGINSTPFYFFLDVVYPNTIDASRGENFYLFPKKIFQARKRKVP